MSLVAARAAGFGIVSIAMVYHLSGNSADHPDLSSAERPNATALPNSFSREPFLRNSDRRLKYISSGFDLGQSVGALVIADDTALATIGTQLSGARTRSVWGQRRSS
jgi:hypothetical protein